MMDIMEYAVCFAVSTISCFLLSYCYMRHERKKIERETIRNTLRVYNNKLTCVSEFIEKTCPECAYYGNCEKMDARNLLIYGKCTNFEQRRF